MKILVTGGAGFLGTHLTKKLIALGHQVISMDNFCTGSIGNIESFTGNSSFEFIEHDVTSPFSMKVDGIFNLACPASPIHYQKLPIETLKTNVLGAINALDLARKLNVRILQASTSEIYGDPKISPQSESYWGNVNSFGFRSCYDEGKRAAETLFFDFHQQYDVDIRIARIFNTYGPLMAKDDGRVISNFIIQALNNEDITIYGKGTQKRSFCYVDDLIDGLIELFFETSANFPVNIGTPGAVSMLEVAKEIISISKSKSNISYLDLPADDPVIREPDISLAKTLMSWTPKVERKEGFTKTINYFKNVI
jgi:UDP-glucuronate decarboxylase